MTSAAITDALTTSYDAMWAEAAPLVRAGGATLDPWLSCPTRDARRGVTLLTRPAPAVASTLEIFLEQLRKIEPSQYYQPMSDLHHTVLSLFTANADYESYLNHLPAYNAAIAESLAGMPPFAITISGITLAPGAVLAQGFPHDGTLIAIRDRLRAALGIRGLGAALDRRYRIETAHMTLVRFAVPLRDPTRFADALATARTTEFGAWVVDDLELVLGDWFHTATHERELFRYRLGKACALPDLGQNMTNLVTKKTVP